MWVRGLKLVKGMCIGTDEQVAPYVGAWIETMCCPTYEKRCRVAPYVGAWIETGVNTNRASEVTMSHPMWVRGLKQRINEIITNNCTSHPMWVRGLKP